MNIEFKAVKRKTQFSFVTPVTEEDIKEFKKNKEIKIKAMDFGNFKISISDNDKINYNSPKIGDMIAINPKNPYDQWLISEEVFKDTHETKIEQFGIKPIILKL